MAIMTHSCVVSASQAAAGGTDIDVTVGSYTSYGLRLWGYYSGFIGSISPSTYEGHTITQLYGNYGSSVFTLAMTGSPADSVFSSIDVETGAGTVNLTSASATITGTTTKTWTWGSGIPDWEFNAANPRTCTFYA